MIRTPEGERRVERLKVGELISTLDRGDQPILWIGTRRVRWQEMARHKGLRPFRVQANALGPGRPHSDVSYSRQHRVLLTVRIAADGRIGATGALAPVHTLALLAGVEELRPTGGIVFVHILTEAHNILWSNGMETETLLLTNYSAEVTAGPDQGIVDVTGAPQMLEMTPARPILHNRTARAIAQALSGRRAGKETSQAM